MPNEIAIKDDQSYIKSNVLINARGHCSLTCQRLFAIGMTNLVIDDTRNVVATIYTSGLRKLYGTDSGYIYTKMEEVCDRNSGHSSLYDWQILLKDPVSQRIESHAVVTDATYDSGVLTIRYNNSLTDMIIDLKDNYTILSLAETMSMESVHSLRLLEILKSRYDHDESVKGGGRHTFVYDIIELKMELGIVKVDSNKKIREELSKTHPDYRKIEEMAIAAKLNKYPSYYDFNNRVLSKAVNEVNSKSDLHVEYEPIRERKKAVGVRFTVERTEKQQKRKITQKEKDQVFDLAVDRMAQDFRASEIRDICEYAEHDQEKILGAYRYLKSYEGEIKSPIAFMKAAIRDGYWEEGIVVDAPDQPIVLKQE